MSYFDTWGPFPIATVGGRCTSSQSDFKYTVRSIEDAAGSTLSTAIGCYVFCLEHRGRMRPWYVGMTVAEKGFVGEIFQQHKLDIFNECISLHRGNPIIFLLPLMKADGYKFSTARKSGRAVIKWLETTLMGFAFRKNPSITNIKEMKNLRNVEVLGLLGKRRGRPFKEAQAIRSALLN